MRYKTVSYNQLLSVGGKMGGWKRLGNGPKGVTFWSKIVVFYRNNQWQIFTKNVDNRQC